MTTYQERCLNTIIRDMEELSCTALSASFKYYTRSEISNLQDFLSTALKEATDNLQKVSEFKIAQISLQLNEVFVYEDPYREHGNNLGDIDYMLYIVAEHLWEHANDIENAKQTALKVLSDRLCAAAFRELTNVHKQERDLKAGDLK